MDLFEAIKKRHSYRDDFKDIDIPKEDLEKIVQAGIMAPSACNAQVVKFIIVDKKDLILKSAEIVQRNVMFSAKAIILCVTDDRVVSKGFAFPKEDVSAAVENMLLAITALDYASVWIDGALKFNNTEEKLKRLFNIPEDKSLRIVLPVGIPEKILEQKDKKSFAERVSFNSY